MNMRRWAMAVLILLLAVNPVLADKADVINVKVTESGPGSYDFAVTVRHNDGGWKHYADSWDVVAPDGKVLGTRTLYHPHVNEQPFTRSLSGIKIPENIDSVILRAHCSVHGNGGKEFLIKLPDK